MSGYENTFGTAKGDAVLSYIMDKLNAMEPKEAKRGHKYLSDVILISKAIKEQTNKKFALTCIPLFKQQLRERGEKLDYHPALISRLLNMNNRLMKEASKEIESKYNVPRQHKKYFDHEEE